MDAKSIRRAIGLFACLIVLGCISTLITNSVLKTKRDALYSESLSNLETTDRETTDDDVTGQTGNISGPMNNILTKEAYLEDIDKLISRIDEIWANVSDVSGNSALSAAKHEKTVWEEQLTDIYELYIKKLSAVELEKAQQDRLNFDVERENRSRAAAKNANEALDGLAYNKEYIKLTKEKTYEYINRYFEAD